MKEILFSKLFLFALTGALALTGIITLTSCSRGGTPPPAKTVESSAPVQNAPTTAASPEQKSGSHSERATFAMGCFWHTEEIFLEIKGVNEAIPGYGGGRVKNPSYQEVSDGGTGHAESVDIEFDPSVVSYQKLLEIFFEEHDPTTPNAQYPDEGPQYRSAIFYRTPEQKTQAQAYIAKLTSTHKYAKPVVTEVTAFSNFYPAEEYHIHYFRNHPDQSYIQNVTKPEVDKFRRDFPDMVKK